VLPKLSLPVLKLLMVVFISNTSIHYKHIILLNNSNITQALGASIGIASLGFLNLVRVSIGLLKAQKKP